jgi:hypothetical protein
MRSGRTNAFSIFQAANRIPIAFFISETRPPMFLGLDQKVFHAATDGGGKQTYTGHAVVKINGDVGIIRGMILGKLNKVCRLPVASVLLF